MQQLERFDADDSFSKRKRERRSKTSTPLSAFPHSSSIAEELYRTFNAKHKNTPKTTKTASKSRFCKFKRRVYILLFILFHFSHLESKFFKKNLCLLPKADCFREAEGGTLPSIQEAGMGWRQGVEFSVEQSSSLVEEIFRGYVFTAILLIRRKLKLD